MSEVWKTAGFRALVTAVCTALLAALAAWAVDGSTKQIVLAFSVPLVTIIGARFGVEGAIDSRNHKP